MSMKRIPGVLLITALTSLCTSCFLYDEKAYNNPYDPKLTDGTYPIPYTEIRIDGDLSEWDGINTFIADQVNEGTYSGQPNIPGGDIDQFKMAQDDENLYFYFSTANGVPLITEGTSLNISFDDEKDNFNIHPVNFNHGTDGTIGWWSNYNYRIDDTNWDGYDLPNSAIRFTGLNTNENAIEFGISKLVYWNQIDTNARVRVEMNTWYEPYSTNFEDGNLDDLWDIDHDYLVSLKNVDEPEPSQDVPLVLFEQGSPIINGLDDGTTEWIDTGFWYQDFENDDTSAGQDNCDIDKVYIKQDKDKVYILLTFFDSAAFTSSTIYNIEIQTPDGGYYHNFYAENNGTTWVTDYVDYQGTQYSAGTSVADGAGFGVEMEFQKDLTWPVIPIGPMNFRVMVSGSGFVQYDHVSFVGSYKAGNDTAPTSYGP